MSQDQITVRLAVLEHLCVSVLGLYLANLRNDPDFSKSLAFLQAIQAEGEAAIAHLPMREDGAGVLASLLDRVRGNLSHLHGGPAVQEH